MPKSKSRHRRKDEHKASLLIVARCPDCGRWLFARGQARSVSVHDTKPSAVAAARRIHDALDADPNRKPHLLLVVDKKHALEELTGDELPSIH